MNNKILLPQLTTLLASTSRLPKKQAEAFIKAFFTTIAEVVVQHENVKIKGFGTFKVNRVEARKSVNVSTGNELEIPAHYKLVFAPAKELAEKVNKDFSWLDIVEISDNLSNEELSSLDEVPENSEKTVAKQPADVSVEQPSLQGVADTSPSTEKKIEEIEPRISEKPENPQEPPRETEIQIEEGIQSNPEPENASNPEPEPEIVAASPSEEVVEIKPVPVVTVASRIESNEKETEGEELGEKLEEEFGQIEPVEPFGPIDPEDPEPGTPLPEQRFYPNRPQDGRYFTREEIENLVTKEDLAKFATKEELATTKKSLRNLKRDVGDAEETSRNSVKKSVIISLLIALLMIVGGLFLVYNLLLDKIKEHHEPPQTEVQENDDDVIEPNDAIVTEIKIEEDTLPQEPQAQATDVPEKVQKDNSTAQAETQGDNSLPTKPSDVKTPESKGGDVKAYDTVTKTRYLTTISRDHYGNYHFWPYIYLENESILGHPDRIKPGTKVKVPDLKKYGVDPNKPGDVNKAKKMSVEIYNKYR